METTPCPKCGQEIPSDAVDCPYCGIVVAKFRNAPPRPEPSSPEPSSPEPSRPEPLRPEPSRPEPSGAHTPSGASEPPPSPASTATPPPAPAAREVLYDPESPTPVYSGTHGLAEASPHGPVTDRMIENLTKCAPWAIFVSILWFLGAVLVGLLMVLGMTVGAAAGVDGAPTVSFLPGTIMVIFYVFLALHLFNFGQAARMVGQVGGVKTVTEKVEEALRYQRTFWRLVGVLTLIFLGLAVLGIAAAIVLPMLLSTGGGGP